MITIVDKKTGYALKGGHDRVGKRIFQYYNDFGCNQIVTKDLTAKQLKRLMDNPKNSEFYIEYQGEFKRIDTVNFEENNDNKHVALHAIITLED
mgnify:CR=1 FL=1